MKDSVDSWYRIRDLKNNMFYGGKSIRWSKSGRLFHKGNINQIINGLTTIEGIQPGNERFDSKRYVIERVTCMEHETHPVERINWE